MQATLTNGPETDSRDIQASPVLVSDLLRIILLCCVCTELSSTMEIVARQNKKTPEYERFEDALRKVLRVSHSDLKAVLDAEKATKKRRRTRRVSASLDSGAGR